MSRKRKSDDLVLDGAEVDDDAVEGEDHDAKEDHVDHMEQDKQSEIEAAPTQVILDQKDVDQNNEDNNVEDEKDCDQNEGDHNVGDQKDCDQNSGDQNDKDQNDKDQNDEDQNDDDQNDEEEDEDDNIKVTIEEYDFKAIQKQSQPAKQPAPLVLQTNQEPIDINYLDEKPWRKPGANIEDYFNYGFDETTWKVYCDKQKHMKAIVDNINEPQETFKIPVINAGPMVQQNSSPYLDVVPQPVAMHQHHQQQHHQAGGSSRMKGVDEDVKKYEKRHRSSERRHSSKSRERRHDVKSREREREKDTERKRSRSRERRSKDTRSRQRSRSREDDRRSKRHKSSRHA